MHPRLRSLLAFTAVSLGSLTTGVGCAAEGADPDVPDAPLESEQRGAARPEVRYELLRYAGSSFSPIAAGPRTIEACLSGAAFDTKRIVLVGAEGQLRWASAFGKETHQICWKPTAAPKRGRIDFVRRDGTILRAHFDAAPRYDRVSARFWTFGDTVASLLTSVEELPAGASFEGKRELARMCTEDPGACEAMGTTKP